MSKAEWEKRPVSSVPNIDTLLDKIEVALVGWDSFKTKHGITPEVIARGNEILAQMRKVRRG